MKKLIFVICSIFLFIEVNSILTEKQREEFLKKYTRKISPNDILEFDSEPDSGNLKSDCINYDIEQIRTIMKTYGFPENYSYLEAHNITARVKDQGKCGSCWSFGATTALSYRYNKEEKFEDLDLSPQDGVSCYIKNCDGNYLTDSYLNLVKNGTRTEECFPYTSGDLSIPECPEKCVGESVTYKKFYAQNVYSTEDFWNENNFYDIVTLIMDQLIKNGPVTCGISVYSDFMDWNKDTKKCHDHVYSYDGKSEYLGGHAMTLVGYGFMENKFYWLIQNSWSDKYCDKGFVKIEFGQVHVEQVSFTDIYDPEEGTKPDDVSVSFDNIDEFCYLHIKSNDLDKWKNSLNINYKSEDDKWRFDYQCSPVTYPGQQPKLYCFYDYWNYNHPRLNFNFKGSESLGAYNKFSLHDSFSANGFKFWGYDTIGMFQELTSEHNQMFFISEEGSRIILFYNAYDDFRTDLPYIYSNKNSENPLSGCYKKKLYRNDYTYYVIYCSIKENELDYFEDYSNASDSPMVYNVLCGYKESTGTFAYKLDKSLYPVFRVKKVYLPDTEIVTSETYFNMEVAIRGTLDDSFSTQMFVILTSFEQNKNNLTYAMLCSTDIDRTKIVDQNYNLTCQMNIDRNITLQYDNIYILPYIIPYMTEVPYEVILKKEIKAGEEVEPEPEPPTDTTEPEHPTDTTEPEHPTDTTEPEPPTDTTEPEPPTDTTEPEHPTDTTEPEHPTDTTEPHTEISSILKLSMITLVYLLLI